MIVDTILWVFGIIFFIILILVSVGAHEAGHMMMARKLNLSVPRFFVGFGPTLWSRKSKAGNEYGIKAIPLGGFVEIHDPDLTDKKDPDRSLLTKVHPAKRISVFAAGPIVNIVIGFAILFLVFIATPIMNVGTSIKSIDTCTENVNCGAYSSNLLPGDNIVAINGNLIDNNEELISTELNKIPNGETGLFTVDRNGELLEYPVLINNHKMGIRLNTNEESRTAGMVANDIFTMTKTSLTGLLELPSKIPGVVKSIAGIEERAEDSPASIVAVADTYGKITASNDFTAKDKFIRIMFYAGVINLSLGFINLFIPMLPLDGGRIFIAIIDWLKMGWSKVFHKKYVPLHYKWVEAMTYATGLLLIGAMGALIVADFIAPIPIA